MVTFLGSLASSFAVTRAKRVTLPLSRAVTRDVTQRADTTGAGGVRLPGMIHYLPTTGASVRLRSTRLTDSGVPLRSPGCGQGSLPAGAACRCSRRRLAVMDYQGTFSSYVVALGILLGVLAMARAVRWSKGGREINLAEGSKPVYGWPSGLACWRPAGSWPSSAIVEGDRPVPPHRSSSR